MDYDYRIEPRDHSFIKLIFGSLFFWVLLLAMIMGTSAIILTYWSPWRANKETEILHGTNQYVTTKQTEMLSKLDKFRDNAVKISELKGDAASAETVMQIESSQKRLRKDIKAASQQIESKFVPRDIKKFLDDED